MNPKKLGDDYIEPAEAGSEVLLMRSSVAIMEDRNLWVRRICYAFFGGLLAILVLTGRKVIAPGESRWSAVIQPGRLDPEQVSREPYVAFVSQLNIGKVSPVPKLPHGASPVPNEPLLQANSLTENPVSAPNEPVAWYKFDGNTNDSAGNAHGSPHGNPTYTQGVYGQAIRFDGREDSLHVPGAAHLFSKISDGITIAFWQYGTISRHHRDTICCSDCTDGSNQPVITINLGCWNQPGQYTWDCGQRQSFSDRLSGEHQHETEWSGRWNHWTFTKDVQSGKMQIFLNGRLFDSRTEANAPISGISAFEIGSGWFGGYDGLLDDFRIYDYALPLSQTAYIATNGTGIFSPPLMNEERRPLESVGEVDGRKVFTLKHLNSEQCINLLSKLGIGPASTMPETNAVLISGSPEDLRRASLVLELVDSTEDFVIENLGRASLVRTLPSNSQIEIALGRIKIGTFSSPPCAGEQARGIIDVQGNSIVAIIPARKRQQLLELLASSVNGMRTGHLLLTATESASNPKAVSMNSQPRTVDAVTLLPAVDNHNADVPKTVRVLLKAAGDFTYKAPAVSASAPVTFNNGEDIIDLNFPETMTLRQLLELAGEYLHLDYTYSPDVVGNQAVVLKFQGSLKGEVKVKDLYTLLETVLKFNGLAMIKGGGRLVTIVPVGQALDADPKFIDETSQSVQAGDVVVTRIFKIKYVDVTSVANLLQQMKLGTVILPSEQTQLLFVTCYARRLSRIEELVSMIDRPGPSNECRFRRLQYTAAPALASKLRTLSAQIQGTPLAETVALGKFPPQAKGPPGLEMPPTGIPQQVYLETDERTNRIVLIGREEQLEVIEDLIDVLDVSQEDLRIPKTYDVKNVNAQDALNKLQELGVIDRPNTSRGVPSVVVPQSSPTGTSPPSNEAAHDGELTEEAKVVVLEATNQLLVRATQEQHTRIGEFLGHIDVIPEDVRTLRVYEMQHVDAEEVRTKLEELEIIRVPAANHAGTISSTQRTISPTIRQTNPLGVKSLTTDSSNTNNAPDILTEKPQVVVTGLTNSLLVNATAAQHAQIATIVQYVDRKLPDEDMPYRIYPLESSSPAHVAKLLEQLIHEAKRDKDDKIQETTKEITKREEKITIVPDPNTFSLVVYASKKNQGWIENLIESLDKRRPQVLIDVTLVEITRTDNFEYDLNIVASAKETVIGNIGIEPIHRTDGKSRLEGGFNLPDGEGNPTGSTQAFYSDGKVQALLTAIARKNYGRILAKPKILVDDGQQGEISTTDETTYLKESVQIPNQGAPITTRDFQPIEAKIQLQITPHISEGKLLRLDVRLSRGDFGTRPTEGAPPDKTTSEITTTVFVPDDNTVILGGLVKLNQSKGGSKVPILGDIPLVGALFRSIDNSDSEKKLYVFLKANIIRPYDEAGLQDLQKVSEQQREIFEQSESKFQKYEDIPGVTPQPMRPERVLEEP